MSIGDLSSVVFFFFFKQKTAYEMSIGDWSSDVCSSDLPLVEAPASRLGDGPRLRMRLPQRELGFRTAQAVPVDEAQVLFQKGPRRPPEALRHASPQQAVGVPGIERPAGEVVRCRVAEIDDELRH